MDQQTVQLETTRARRRFSPDCRVMSNKIRRLQIHNEGLSLKLEALIVKKKLLIDRIRATLETERS